MTKTKRNFIPQWVRNLELELRESSRGSTIASPSVLEIQRGLRSLNPGTLTRLQSQVSDRLGYTTESTEDTEVALPQKKSAFCSFFCGKAASVSSVLSVVKFLFLLLCPLSAFSEEEKPFVIVVVSHNNSDWVEQNLDSIFSQNYHNYRVVYIADAPTDGTAELARAYIAERKQNDRVTLLENREQRGLLACMCQAVFSCRKEEIVLELEGCDWLAHNDVLNALNSVYADPEVWMTYGQFLYYPSFRQGFAAPIPQEVIEHNDFRHLSGHVTHARTFYAALFQEIDKADFLYNGSFFPEAGDLSYLIPLLEMSGEHAQFIPDILYMFNYTFPASNHRAGSALAADMDKAIRSKNSYFPLPELPLVATTPPASIYSQIADITHPTLSDYRLIQNYLASTDRGLRGMKLMGTSAEETPRKGKVHINCDLTDKENCVILYSTFNRNYPLGLKRLLKHIIDSDFKGHVLYQLGGWPDEEGGSLPLAHVPYAFKASFFKRAQREGFKRVLWLDAAVLPLVSLNEIFGMIEEKGYFVMGNSHQIGPYMTPEAAAYFGLTLDQTHQIPSCSAGLFGLDLTQDKPRELLDLWYRAAFDKDAFFSPRADQNALSILLDQFAFFDLTDIRRMPHAEVGDPIQPDSLFYLDRIFVQ
jgi:glycosyltransferase involved in cell wall biosynthesis